MGEYNHEIVLRSKLADKLSLRLDFVSQVLINNLKDDMFRKRMIYKVHIDPEIEEYDELIKILADHINMTCNIYKNELDAFAITGNGEVIYYKALHKEKTEIEETINKHKKNLLLHSESIFKDKILAENFNAEYFKFLDDFLFGHP